LKPLIGITCFRQELDLYGWREKFYILPSRYFNAIQEVGAIPVILPPEGKARDYATKLDGLLVSGGDDVDPQLYNEKRHPKTQGIDRLRDEFEIELIKLFASNNLPVLAICRGIQVLNVAFGGTLLQDIPEEIKSPVTHWQDIPEHMGSHKVSLFSDTLINIFGSDILVVNSFHHQAINTLGLGLKVAARSEDGLIEALEHLELDWVIGVQWHPETMVKHAPLQKKLFDAFVKSCVSKKL